jgi:anthranilate/para-aminobenzoate synthase component II
LIKSCYHLVLHPEEAYLLKAVIENMSNQYLRVCLGQQAIGEVITAHINLDKVYHGIATVKL